MKLLLSALVLSFASIAQASPAVGDSAMFRGTWGSEAIEQTLTFTEFNASTRQFKQVTTTTIGKEAPATTEELVNYDDTASDAALQAVLDNCAVYGGVNETTTVPAGTFPTCKLAMEAGGYVYIGVVPFAVVRMDTMVEGQPLVADLISFTRGN